MKHESDVLCEITRAFNSGLDQQEVLDIKLEEIRKRKEDVNGWYRFLTFG